MKNMNNNMNEDINNQRVLSFEDVNKNIDYSPIDEELRKSNLRKSILQKASIGLASVVLVVGVAFGIDILHDKTPKIPFELGTYTYTSQVGEIEGLDFSEQSYIVLSEEELNGPGTFVIENDEQDWVVYGQFYNCLMETYTIGELAKVNNSFVFTNDIYNISIMINDFVNDDEIVVEIMQQNNLCSIFFTNNQ